MKPLRLLLATGLLLGITAACRAGDKKEVKDETNKAKIVGTWMLEKPQKPKNFPPGATIEFTKDGKLLFRAILMGRDISHEGTYSVHGDKVTTTSKDPEGKDQSDTDTIIKLTDNQLVVKISKTEEELTFKKK
jgi:uncharacterized protein (TIGR03066 family)